VLQQGTIPHISVNININLRYRYTSYRHNFLHSITFTEIKRTLY